MLNLDKIALPRNMPNNGFVQLNISVPPETKEKFKKFCELANLSFAQSIERIVDESEKRGCFITEQPPLESRQELKDLLISLKEDVKEIKAGL